MENIKIFRYKIHYWDEIEDSETTDYGFVFGFSIGDAVDRVESIYKKPNGDSLMIDIFIYEIDAYECGVLTDDTIKETKDSEQNDGYSKGE